MNAENKGPCRCRKCLTDGGHIHAELFGTVSNVFIGMIVCSKCGNKRCPHATDHRHKCTNSNEPGQPGSVYQ